MTKYLQKMVRCRRCGRQSEHQVLASTNRFGSFDLDLRPPEMERSTMSAWIQLCPHCGYAAPSLSHETGEASVLSTPEYRAALGDERFPELARRFLAHALCVMSEPAVAGRSRLCAAWVCDDEERLELAIECRLLAAECFERLRPFGDSDDGVAAGAVFVDILRRAGRFEQARSECDRLLEYAKAKGVVRHVLEYERRLIAQQDAAARRVDECAAGLP